MELSQKPALLWKPYALEKPEPECVISFEGQHYAICYTLLYSLIGWVQMGKKGSLIGFDGGSNLVLAMQKILREMDEKFYPLDPQVIAAYEAQGIRTARPPLPEVKDYRHDAPMTKQDLIETASMRSALF